MTTQHPLLMATLSANDVFKLRYPRYLKGAALLAMALTALFVWLWPGHQAEPYRLRQKEVIELIELEPVAPIDETPPPIEVPPIPINVEPAPNEDPEAIDTIPDLMPINPTWYRGPQAPPTDDGFVSSSSEPVLQYNVKADYPEIARRAQLQGTVLVHVLVDVTGRVDKAVISQGVHPLLDKAAMAAALRCRFTPGKQRQRPVPVWVAIPYRFRLQ